MKKITAFFMAILPFVVVVLLYATGLIVKDVKYVDVKYIEVVNDSLVMQKTTLDTAQYDFTKNVVINPTIASDPVVYYQSTDTNVIDFQGQSTSTNGIATIKDFKDDVTINCWAKAKPDDIKHFKFSCVNDKVLGIRADDVYLFANGTANVEATTIPSTHVTSNLTYKVADEKSKELIDVGETTGQIKAKDSKEGTATVTITNNNKEDPSQQISKDIKVHIIPYINTIGFKDESSTLATESSSYNLFEQIYSQPTNVKTGDEEYFNYTSSDETIATVNDKGVVTFKQPHKPVDIYASFKADELVYAKRTLTSTMKNYVDVTFNQYSRVVNMNDLSNDQEITGINYSTYPQTIEGKTATITSDNPSVAKVENNKVYAVAPGTCNLTVTVNTSGTTTVQDRMSLTILPGSTSKILNVDSLDLKDVHYYYLNSAVKNEFKDQDVKWTAVTTGTDVASLDTTTNIVHFKKAGEFKVKASLGSSSQELTLKVSDDKTVTQLDGEDEENIQKIAVGKKFQFVDSEKKALEPTFDEETAKLVTEVDKTNHIYIANVGSQEVKEITIGEATVQFVISEEAVDIKPVSDLTLWPNYTTNAEKVSVGDKIKIYPTTATLDDGAKAEITFNYTVDDKETLVWPIQDNVLQILKPTTVKINAKFNNIEKNFSVKSYAGLNGKFSMEDDKGDIQSGVTYDNLKIGETKTLKIKSFQLPDVDTSSESALKKGFTFQSLNQNGVVKLQDIKYANRTLEFAFTGLNKGEDVIAISNGSFTFYVNVKINEAKITDFNLLCNDEEVQENETSYSKNLTLFVGINPISATEVKYKVSINGTETAITNNTIQLDESKWSNNVCDIKLETLDGKVTKEYKLTYSDAVPTVKIIEAVDVGGKKYLYSRAGAKYIAATFSVNGLIDDNYYSQHFIATGPEKSECSIISNTLLVTMPEATENEPGYEGDIKVSSKASNWEESYHISRDIVSRVELPDNNNYELSDHKGMQKVHVYGNKTFYSKEEGNVGYYKVPVDLYDFRGNKITDLTKKEAAINTLSISASAGSSVTYDKANGYFKYTFSADAAKLYTFDEIYNNVFATYSKDQTINVTTKWAEHTLDLERRKEVNKSYNFVVVDATNVFNQEGLQANHGENASIVLQINFGLEKVTKENTPLTDWTLSRWKYVYGNGYSINFDARTSYDKDKRPHEEGKNDFLTTCFDGLINTNVIDCNDATFDNICKINKHKYNSIANAAGATTHFAYCKFSNFYQVMTLWGNSTNYIKNCVYNNNGAVCLSISDTGNKTYIEDTGFFKCSNVAIILQKNAGLYLKGNIQVFNFVKNDIFKDIGGHDLSFMWEIVQPILDEMGFLQWGADGQNHINAYCVTLFPDDFYFWDAKDGKYYPSAEAISQHKQYTNHLEKSIDVPILGGVSIWTTKKPNTDPHHVDYGCPSYYQEYDKDGNIKNDELINLINRLSREISF